MSKEKETTVQYSFRLNLNIPEHMMIHKALSSLDENLYKTKSGFIIDALDKYVKGISPEALVEALSERDFVTKSEIDDMREDMREDIIRSVTKTVTKEVTRNMSSIFANAFSTDHSMINIDCSLDDI